MSAPAKATNSASSTRWYLQAKRWRRQSAGRRPSARTARCRSAPPSKPFRRALRSRWSRRLPSSVNTPPSRRWWRRRIISRGRRRFLKSARRNGRGNSALSFRGDAKHRTRNLDRHIPFRDSGSAPAGASRNDSLNIFCAQLPLVRRIIRLIDRELVHRGLPQMRSEPRRLQIGIALRDAVGEPAIEFAECALFAQQARQPRGFRRIAGLRQRQLAGREIQRIDRDPQLERDMSVYYWRG